MNGHTAHTTPSFHPSPGKYTFLASKEYAYTYSNLYGFSEWLHNETAEHRFTDNQPLLILAEPGDEAIFLIAASFLLKIPILPLHPDTTEQELGDILNHLNPPVVYTDQPEKFQKDSSALSALSIPKEVLQTEKKWDPELFSLEDAEDVAGLFMTSGTTSQPKIVPVKRRQVLFAAAASAENFKPENNGFWLLCLPLNHVSGVAIIFRSILYQSAIFRLSRFDEHEVRKLLSEDKRFQVASMVPTMLVKLMEETLFQVHFNFKAILLGGGPISLDLIKKSVTRGLPIVTSYGMTETFGQIAANPILKPRGFYLPKTSVGTIFEPNEIEIRDENGVPQRHIESGQIWLRGPQVFDGYSNASLNKDVFDKNGWFNTGDYGHLNQFRQLFIENRRTDLIVTGGENVNPDEIETLLNALDNVQECAVVGIPDKKWGQKIVAFLVTTNELLQASTIDSELKKKVRGFKIPKEYLSIDKLPKTELGKIKKAELVKLYLKQSGQAEGLQSRLEF